MRLLPIAALSLVLTGCTGLPRDERPERPTMPFVQESRLSAHWYEISPAKAADVDSHATSDALVSVCGRQWSADRIAPVFAATRFELPSSREWMRRIEEFQVGTGFDSGVQILLRSQGGLFEPNRRFFLGGSFDPGMLDNSQW